MPKKTVKFNRQGAAKLPIDKLCLLFIHPRSPNLIGLRSTGTIPT